MLPLTFETANNDPFTLPWWRWAAAQYLRDNPSDKSKTGDPHVHKALGYLNGNKSQYPLINAARAIFEQDGLTRAEIEARILVGNSDAAIGERCKIAPEVVETYETLFFTVRHLRRIGRGNEWLYNNMVGDARFHGFQNRELRQLWAWFALDDDPNTLDEIIGLYRRALRSGDAPTVDVYLRENSGVPIDFQAYIAARTVSPYGMGGLWWQEFDLRLLDAQTEAQTEKVKREIVAFGRSVLAGNPVMPPPVRPPRPASKRTAGSSSQSERDNVLPIPPAATDHGVRVT